ncbi:MAG TPA: acyltransferase [Armatimonadota bacterium]|nr:acyltransferase [Armatimonadota bacterium]HQK93218.1 acyltransferase [Armatimonadota bacterium]
MAILDRVFARLSRVTSTGRFVPQIDGLRFVAIAVVILFHTARVLEEFVPTRVAQWPEDPLWILYKQGFCGVQLFFGISGFILALPFAEQHIAGQRPVSLARYFLRRVTRLEPPYFINLFSFFILRTVLIGESAQQLLPHLLASIFYVHNIAYDTSSTMVNPVAWSLEIEVQFYIMAPLISRLFTIRNTSRRRAAIVALALAFGALRAALVRPESEHGWNLITELPFFLVGFLLADLYLVDWHKQPKQTFLWDVFSGLAWAALFPWIAGTYLDGLVTPILIFIAYVGAFRGVLGSRVFSNPWLVTIGGMCYTIYLYHYAILMTLGPRTVHLWAGPGRWADALFQTALLFPPVILVSAGLFAAFEKPFMQRDWPSVWRTTIRGWLRRPSVEASPGGGEG